MSLHNVVCITGNATDDAELRFTPSGAAVANFTVAANSRKREEDGTWTDVLDGFFRVNCWRDLAENVAESIKKGDRVTVLGKVQIRTYEKKDGGGTGYSTEITAEEVALSLRWATASAVKSPSSGKGSKPGDKPTADWGQPAEPPPAPVPAEAVGVEGGF